MIWSNLKWLNSKRNCHCMQHMKCPQSLEYVPEIKLIYLSTFYKYLWNAEGYGGGDWMKERREGRTHGLRPPLPSGDYLKDLQPTISPPIPTRSSNHFFATGNLFVLQPTGGFRQYYKCMIVKIRLVHTTGIKQLWQTFKVARVKSQNAVTPLQFSIEAFDERVW